MAKKKKRKNAKKQDLGYMIELKGLFLVIISRRKNEFKIHQGRIDVATYSS